MKLLNRVYAPSKHSSGYLKVNNPKLAARYVFKDSEVVDEVTGLTIARMGNGGVRLPVPDLNAGYSVRVAYNTLGATANSTLDEVLRIGTTLEKSFALQYRLSRTVGATGILTPILQNWFELSTAAGTTFTANSGNSKIPSGLQILEFNVRGALSTKDVASDAPSNVYGSVGEYFKIASQPLTFGSHLYVNPTVDQFLTTEFASANCQIVFIEVYKPKSVLAPPTRSIHTNHSNSYFGVMCSDSALLPNLKCNIGVFDGAVTDSIGSSIGTFGNGVSNGYIDLSQDPLKLIPQGADLEWSCKFVAIPVAVDAETALFSIKRGLSVLDVTLDTQGRISADGQSAQLHTNGKYDVVVVGLNDAILVYVDGVLRVSGTLPITYPLKSCEVELKAGLGKVNGVQYYDCSLLNSDQMYNSAVTDVSSNVTLHSVFENENASIDYAQGRDTGLNPVPFNLLLGTILTAFRIPNVPKAPVVGVSADVTLFSSKNSNGDVDCKFSALVNGQRLEFTISLSGYSLGEVGFALSCGTQSVKRWLKIPTNSNAFGDWNTNLQIQVCDSTVIASVLGRNFVVPIAEAPLYDLSDITWFTSRSAQGTSNATSIAVHSLVTYTGDSSNAAKIPSFANYSAERPWYSADKYPTLVMAFGVDQVELVTNTSLPVTPNLVAQEKSRGLLISPTDIGNIACVVPDLPQFTLSLTFIPEGSQWVSLTLGAMALTLNANGVRLVLGALDVMGTVVPYAGPRELVMTYTGTEIVATINAQEVIRVPYTGVIPGTTNLGMNSYGQGSFTLVDFRLYSSVVAAVPGKQAVLRSSRQLSSDVSVALSALAVTQSEPNGLGAAVFASVAVYSLVQQTPLEMEGAEVTVEPTSVLTLVTNSKIPMDGAEVTVAPTDVYVLIEHEA